MKVGNKAFLVLTLIWVAFLLVTYPLLFRISIYFHTLITLLFVLVSAQILYFLVKKIPEEKNIRVACCPKEEVITEENIIAPEKNTLTQLAHYDLLTGLPNRVFFNDILNKSIKHATRHKKTLAILAVNIDDFKNIQRRYGDDFSNNLLKEIAKKLSKALRTEDVIAKFDGDEFIILLSDIGKAKFAGAVAEKILAAFHDPYKVNSQSINVKASIGICIFPNDAHSLEELFNNVTTALEAVKNKGGNNYRFYSIEMDTEAREYVQLGNSLREALDKKQFILYFQPKLLIKTGNIWGVETFLRWQHPEHGLIPPEKFIFIAEEMGLTIPIGEWMLQEVCRINKNWQNEGYEHLTIAVNLSPKQFSNPYLPQAIKKALSESGLDPCYLELEVSENTVMSDVESSGIILNKIKETGVKISIDHFGAGYISVKHLKDLPICSVKIDHNFIKGVPSIPNDTAITNAFIALAHNLGLETVAEGVETIEQAQYLAAQNCDVVQGYFLSHPVPLEKITLQFRKLMDTVL